MNIFSLTFSSLISVVNFPLHEYFSLYFVPSPTHPAHNVSNGPTLNEVGVGKTIACIGYSKIPKISPGANIFQRPFLRGLFLEGFMYEGKFTFQNRSGQPYSWKEFYRFFFFVLLCKVEDNFQVQDPGGAYIWRGDLTEGFLRYEFGGLIHGGAYFRSLTVFQTFS